MECTGRRKRAKLTREKKKGFRHVFALMLKIKFPKTFLP